MPFNIPNLLTLSRILLIPVFVAIYYLPLQWLDSSQKDILACSIFVFSSITDWFDGWLARKLDQMSEFGKFLDPVADKLSVCAALFVLVHLGRVDAFIGIIIIGREISISALREWMAKLGASNSVAVSYIGKLKTTAQMVAIPVLLVQSNGIMITIGTVLMAFAALLTVVSMVYYMQKAWPEIKSKTASFDAVSRIKRNPPPGVVRA